MRVVLDTNVIISATLIRGGNEDQILGAADHYALTMDSKVLDPNLYFRALVKYSAVPVHPSWKTWLFSRAAKKKEIEGLSAHRIRGIKIHLNDESLAQDIMRGLKKGRLRKDWRAPLFPAKFDSSAMHI